MLPVRPQSVCDRSLTKLEDQCSGPEVQFHRHVAPPHHRGAESTSQSDTWKRTMKISGEQPETLMWLFR